MKMRITDVKKIIREIAVDTLLEHDFRRDFKMPSAADMAKIQREFGHPINFENIVVNPENFDGVWRVKGRKQGTEESLSYYITGLGAKNVHSTMDDDYALFLAAMSYGGPFDKPDEYMAISYGPKELMRQWQLSLDAEIYTPFEDDQGEGTAQAIRRLNGMGFLNFAGERIYRIILEVAKESNIIVDPQKLPNDGQNHMWRLTFKTTTDLQNVIQYSFPHIKKMMAEEFPKVGARLDWRGSASRYIFMELYNKYTNMWVARVNFFNVELKYKIFNTTL